jgi:phosphatidylethanolamine/phosphatidyl-N-methylethanolamine N-methyltransferase
MAKDYDLKTNISAYEKWAPHYDKIYTYLLREARSRAVKAAVACGTEVLEVGVGTGLSLPEYPAHVHVTGCDLSEPMLGKAREKIAAHNLQNVRGLLVMDACHLGFADARFDAVAAQFLLTLVPSPEQALDEFARVLKPEGEIIIANHIGAESGPMAAFEKAAAPIARKLGWRADFPLQRIRDWAERAGFAMIEAEKTWPLGYFMVIRLKRRAA